MTNETELLDKSEAAAILRIRPCTLDKLAKRGEGPVRTLIAARIFYRRDHVEEFLNKQATPPAKAGGIS